MGLHKMIDDPAILWALFEDYKEDAKSNPIRVQDFVGKGAEMVYRDKERPLTMEGFENFVSNIDGMPWGLEQYFSNREGRYSDFVAICSRIRRFIRNDQVSGGMVGIYNPSITQRLNSLTEKIEQSGPDGKPIEINITGMKIT